VLTLNEDGDGTLWVGTYSGLNKYRPTLGFSRYYLDKNLDKRKQFILAGQVNSFSDILIDKKNRVWVKRYKSDSSLHEGSGLFLLNSKTNTLDAFAFAFNENNTGSILSSTPVDAYQDKAGNFWFNAHDQNKNALARYDFQTKQLTFYTHDPENPASLSPVPGRKIMEDSKGNVWIGLNKGLDMLNIATGEFTHYVPDDSDPSSIVSSPVLSLAEDDSGVIWIGTETSGLDRLDRMSGKFTHFKSNRQDPKSLWSDKIQCLYNDKAGTLWIGTDNGVNLYTLNSRKFRNYLYRSDAKGSSQTQNIRDVCVDKRDNIFYCTDKAVYKFRDNHEPELIISAPCDKLEMDASGRLWISEKNKLFIRYDTGTGAIKKFFPALNGDDIFGSISEVYSHDKMIWLATGNKGVNGLDTETGNVLVNYLHNPSDANSIGRNDVRSIFMDKGLLWIGPYNAGINSINLITNKITKYRSNIDDPATLSNDIAVSILKDRKDRLWVGTENGLNLLLPDSTKFKRFSENLGKVYSLLEDKKGNIWFTTFSGVSMIDSETFIIKNYDSNDGFQTNSSMKLTQNSKNEIILFGENGFTMFDPGEMNDNSILPYVTINDFQIFNKTILPGKDSPLQSDINETREIALSYRESFFSFGFAAQNYVLPEKNQYAYKLEGFESEWNYVGTRRSAYYTSVPPGEYIFKVKASNNDGAWNEEGTSIKLSISPPLWQTWWFRVFSICAIAGSIFYFMRARSIAAQTKRTELEGLVRQRTVEVVQQKEAIEKQSEYLQNVNEELVKQKEAILLQQEKTEEARTEAEKAMQIAEKANQAKSIFLATMSHEIRTPMNGVIGMASLLFETTQTTEQQEYTETIRNCGESLLTVINDILDFSKIESGSMEIEQKDFDLRTCIEEVLDVFSSKAAKTGLDLIYEIDSAVPPQIVGDSVRLRQVILNLVSNAVKFTHHGEIFVNVHLLHKKDDTVELGFEVRDTGIGIPEDKLHRLFKAFSQVDSSTTRQYGGTGLGLVICEKLVGLMGGQILVESIAGKGTTFTFTIKAMVSQQATRTYVHHNVSGIEGKRVLIIDDNQTNRNIFKNQLEQWKLVPTLASSGKEALEILAQISGFDLVLSDMQMPGMDGMQLARSIRKIQAILPIILLSSVGDERNEEQRKLFASVLTKPVKQHTLFKHIVAQLSPQKTKAVDEDTTREKKLSIAFAQQYPLRILIAEDNPVNQKLAERVLTKLGYIPDKALNGQEALNAMDKKTYDVILMDVQMPVMDGLEATREIRKRKDSQPLIIAMTANAMQGDREICILAGMDDYISKPIKLESLVNLLEKYALQINA
jgi:signal transduction histidine kinase/DNA-binding response OmpR family regulator/ligand-binding sensor domain-containing protein